MHILVTVAVVLLTSCASRTSFPVTDGLSPACTTRREVVLQLRVETSDGPEKTVSFRAGDFKQFRFSPYSHSPRFEIGTEVRNTDPQHPPTLEVILKQPAVAEAVSRSPAEQAVPGAGTPSPV